MENGQSQSAGQTGQEISSAKAIDAAPDTGSIQITISDDKLSCWITINKTADGSAPDISAVQFLLGEKKIDKKAILNDVLEKIYDQSLFGQEFLVAEGTPPVEGKKGRIKYYFETNPDTTIKKDEKGNVDFKESSMIQQVKSGDLLAELIPPVKGEDGLGVTGEIVEAEVFEPVKMPIGKNTAVDKKDENKVIAFVDGMVSLKKDKVNVDPVMVIDGDIDYASGNIDFDGAVIVKGGMKAGFKIKSESDVTVKEVVEDAIIETDGNVMLKSGFIGRGEGKIKAGGNVTLPFSENQYIYAGGDVRISDALLNSNVEADGEVIVSGTKGVLGGSTSSSKLIEVQSAGSQAFTKTRLKIILNRETRDKMEQNKTDVENHKANTIKIGSLYSKLEKLKHIKKELSPAENMQFSKLGALKKKLEEENETLENTKKELTEAYSLFENAYIKIKREIHPGVSIEIGSSKYTVKEKMSNIMFKIKDGEIAALRPSK